MVFVRARQLRFKVQMIRAIGDRVVKNSGGNQCEGGLEFMTLLIKLDLSS